MINNYHATRPQGVLLGISELSGKPGERIGLWLGGGGGGGGGGERGGGGGGGGGGGREEGRGGIPALK